MMPVRPQIHPFVKVKFFSFFFFVFDDESCLHLLLVLPRPSHDVKVATTSGLSIVEHGEADLKRSGHSGRTREPVSSRGQ